ncbi:MarR family winged helix-turn-helix transcriptional regulator [Azospirillum canadense]|uniref:MarR family winged helix-turn-helix transcriptional regulator n=1 Tax=Azospirillum canadense TaxID=403962 RepID=UPI002226DE3B|nr:MarR family winged helix-turn-helix transcriptional regulator [Azospirillum canadense]
MTGKSDVPSHCNCAKIRRAARHITRFYDSCLAAVGIRATQYTLLGCLNSRGPMTMLQLATLVAMDRATVGHNLRPLERDGLVSIKVSEKDRRARIVSVTDAGLDLLARGRPGWEKAQAEFERLYGTQNASAMRAMMDEVVACDLPPGTGA